MAGGRLKLKLSDLPKDWQEKTLELASEGASDVEIRVEALGCICHETWDRLLREEPEFSETIKKARDLCHYWWQKQGRVNLKDNTFSTALWFINMKNRFGWRDKQEINQNITVSTLADLISQKKLIKQRDEEAISLDDRCTSGDQREPNLLS